MKPLTLRPDRRRDRLIADELLMDEDNGSTSRCSPAMDGFLCAVISGPKLIPPRRRCAGSDADAGEQPPAC